MRSIAKVFLGGALLLLSGISGTAAVKLPNVVFVLADDMGVGDVSALNPEAKVSTPALDGLVAGGLHFTDAHTSAAVCTPTRYGLMTGRYSWRGPSKERVLSGYSPCIIPPSRETIASLMKKAGYDTAMFGKWHLGITWTKKDGSVYTELKPDDKKAREEIDFSAPIRLGPNELGFDYFYGVAASWDMAPYAFIENDRLQFKTLVEVGGRVGPLPPAAEGKRGEALKTVLAGYPKATWRIGPGDSELKAEDGLPRLIEKATDYVEGRSGDKPFFLYLALTAPHTPVVPTPEFRGKSRAGTYGDFVQEVDRGVGEIVKALKKKGLFENTLFVFTTDNGYSHRAFPDAQKEQYGHNPSYIYNGCKGRLLEGGHRVPFIVSWPGVTKPGTRSDALVCLTDTFATLAELTGRSYPESVAEDSISFLPVLKGESETGARDMLVTRDFGGYLAVRQGYWKLCTSKNPKAWKLYDLKSDVSETKNLFKQEPERVETLKRLLKKLIAQGRSTPGEPQRNDGPSTWPQIEWTASVAPALKGKER